MLKHLNIHHFGLIHTLNLPLEPGLTAFTGETGAGKSMILDAISGALGEKSGEHHTQTDSCVVLDAIYQGTPWLLQFEQSTKKKRYRFNGANTSARQLRVYAQQLVHFHGQHAQMDYLSSSQQRVTLDAFLHLQPHVHAVAEAFEQLENTQMAVETTRKQLQAVLDQQAQASELMDQLTALDPLPGEWETLCQKQKQWAKRKTLENITHGIMELLETSPHGRSLGAQLLHWADRCSAELETAPHLKPLITLLKEAACALEEARYAIPSWDIESDEEAADIDARLAAYFDTARKCRCGPEHLAAMVAEMAASTHAVEQHRHAHEQAQKHNHEAQQYYHQLARTLSESRQQGALPFAEAVCQHIRALGMPQAIFSVKFTAEQIPQSHGLDHVEFWLHSVPEMPPGPMKSVASGGELSRLALVFACLLANSPDAPDSFVFDEPDTGIGGQTAHLIGQLFQTLSRTKQVLIVTHLPQVAAFADQHVAIQKITHATGNQLAVQHLASPEERFIELARMLGDASDPIALEHAKSLRKNVQEITNKIRTIPSVTAG